MQAFYRSLVLGTLLALPAGTALAQTPAPTALDAARILSQHSGPLDAATVEAIFGSAFTANMRVPPEHLGVAFYDNRTGAPLDPQEVRELIGPVRQDGAHELFAIAEALFGDNLPLATEQLRSLLDAAFLASMRRPPPHIEVEFYDRREGPSGRGGGVSGRVPEARGRSSQPERQPPAAEAAAPQLPRSRNELREKLRGLAFEVEARPGAFLFPLVTWGRPGDDFEQLLLAEVAADEEMHSLGIEFLGLASGLRYERQEPWVLAWALGYFSTDDPELEQEARDLLRGLYP